MTPLCLNASLETLRPLYYHCMHCLKVDLCHSLHEGFFQALQVVVMPSAHHVLQNSPEFIVQEVRSELPKGQHWALLQSECKEVSV